MPPKVLGLDLSLTATGVARPGGDLDTIKPTTQGDHRLVEIEDTLALDLMGVDLVVVEDFVVHSNAASVLGMLHGVIRSRLIRNEIAYLTVTPKTLKVFATGRGNATKPDMRVELFRRTEIDERDDNRVDAWWLRALGLYALGAPVDTPDGLGLTLPKTHTRALDAKAVRAQLDALASTGIEALATIGQALRGAG